jgi:hypothetical protein
MNHIDPVELAEKIINLLDSARHSTTYKWATLDAIVQVVTENVKTDGQMPNSISGKAVGRKVFDVYWRQSIPFSATKEGLNLFLKQSTGPGDIPARIAKFRLDNNLTAVNDSLSIARIKHPQELTSLEQLVQDTVIRMPLPKLQRFGDGANTVEKRFLYEYSWEDEVAVTQIHRPDFDDSMTLQPGIAEGLIKIQGLIRPYIETLWIQWVADRNKNLTDAAKLHDFLFGVDRKSLSHVKPHLIILQGNKCFYCDSPLSKDTEVDHFLPFSKHNDDSLDNLVAACRKCNNSKSDSYPSIPHLKKWVERFIHQSKLDLQLSVIALSIPHMRDSISTASKARAVYLNKPEGTVLWHSIHESTSLRHKGAREALIMRKNLARQSH